MISINNLTKKKVSAVFLKGVAKIVLKGENTGKGKELSIVLIEAPAIKKLNQKYRKKNKPTDVLSFPAFVSKSGLRRTGKCEEDFLGEIVICPKEVKKNAKENKMAFKKELAFVLIHGILHLLGYSHEGLKKEAEIMDKKTEKYLFKINL
ncbi:rRNA maturation RNase YbeY [Patescibacteria group bacterium]|nr:rRNA maturation RNase YbeY [Patescibacteria group bacterium]MBU4274505.1 rRNA maturation RNase YbeY [Patescibacteria group bacterium]MBU4367410.1 rRNA maturation RNase YbeY [Patescibacteria group bacterium]MBU4461730.1 rRNA maturation RNase YbeY [Patescibacteria group bacterium]MCG2700114.1 rRNA maturation RNase YbeY [Candidatus Parcubacteria bacterium]